MASKSKKYISLYGNRGWLIKCECQNFSCEFINSCFCACAVKIWLTIAENAAKSPNRQPCHVKSHR